MELTITWENIIGLFAVMAILASIPSLSVLTVCTKSITEGFRHGVLTSMGVVCGDIIFIIIAIYGLSFLAERGEIIFQLIKYFGGIYLIWLGLNLWKSKVVDISVNLANQTKKESLIYSFITGLSITLADQKAVLFYLGFLPAFINISTVSYLDTFIIIIITFFSVGGVKIIYAFMAHKILFLLNTRVRKYLNFFSGLILITIAITLLIRV